MRFDLTIVRRFHVALLLSACAACGASPASGDADSGHSTKDADAASAAPEAGPSSGGDDAGPSYAGIVLATMTQSSPPTFALFTDFVPSIEFVKPSVPSCGCVTGFPTPTGPTPNAGVITLGTSAVPKLASLLPSSNFSPLQGTSSLGGSSTWSHYPGAYVTVTSSQWNAGDALLVSAAGGDVDAFSGTLHAGSLLTGVTPAIGAAGTAVNRAQDLRVSWAPGGSPGDQVSLMVDQTTPDSIVQCACFAPDAAGTIALASSYLSQFKTTQLSATVALARTTASTVTTGNASVQLVGEVIVSGPATFE